ncbi:helix-turn-helix protein [Tamaricihabitans halophyticus]|uniref:Helix-turn-helix protein n=1 Tax=Tamaricihabitans halophyticus TaxID=1262583 RepID=A0A4R2QXG7_9PSEU|nr:helix-turn-helix transcriptional regulator [Tamaricihabitans halophyticus]TCP54880.1 helix-turn-helix protein [Tamaricihabitans halophyticus]
MSSKEPTTTWRQRRIARMLRAWRDKAGVRQQDVCAPLKWSTNKLHRYETTKTTPGPAEIIALAYQYGTVPDAERDRVVQLVLSTMSDRDKGLWDSYAPETVPDFFREYLETEIEASKVLNAESVIVPGLLQTANYSDALLRGEMDDGDQLMVDRRELRKQRQARLDSAENPLELHVVIHELALLARVGGAETMREQCAHLVERAELPNITVQVIPVDVGAHPGFGSNYTMLQFDHEDELVIYWENADSSIYLENDEDTESFTLKFERACSAALEPGASRELLLRHADGKF